MGGLCVRGNFISIKLFTWRKLEEEKLNDKELFSHSHPAERAGSGGSTNLGRLRQDRQTGNEGIRSVILLLRIACEAK